jgi:hypothetical protein
MLPITIRPATRHDYPAIVAIGRSATADYVHSVADLEHGDQVRPPGVIHRNWWLRQQTTN